MSLAGPGALNLFDGTNGEGFISRPQLLNFNCHHGIIVFTVQAVQPVTSEKVIVSPSKSAQNDRT